MQYFIDVILPIPLVKLFTYSINAEESKFLKPGMRVAVPFGKSKLYTAIVFSIHQNAPDAYEAKDIHQILDEHSVVNTYQLKFWKWISEYYLCSLGDVMRASLPSSFLLESETLISKTVVEITDENELSDEEFIILEALEGQSSLKVSEVSSLLNKKNVLKPIKNLLGRGYVKLQEEIYEQYKPKLVKYVRLSSEFDSDNSLHELLDNLSRAKKQKDAIMAYFVLKSGSEKPIKAKLLVEKASVSTAVLKGLVDKNILEYYYVQTDRNQFANDITASKTLNDHQQKALAEVEMFLSKIKFVC